MNEIDSAIKDFEHFKEMGYGHADLPSSHHIELAIDALRAQQEMEDPQPLKIGEIAERTLKPVYVVDTESCVEEWMILDSAYIDCSDDGNSVFSLSFDGDGIQISGADILSGKYLFYAQEPKGELHG